MRREMLALLERGWEHRKAADGVDSGDPPRRLLRRGPVFESERKRRLADATDHRGVPGTRRSRPVPRRRMQGRGGGLGARGDGDRGAACACCPRRSAAIVDIRVTDGGRAICSSVIPLGLFVSRRFGIALAIESQPGQLRRCFRRDLLRARSAFGDVRHGGPEGKVDGGDLFLVVGLRGPRCELVVRLLLLFLGSSLLLGDLPGLLVLQHALFLSHGNLENAPGLSGAVEPDVLGHSSVVKHRLREELDGPFGVLVCHRPPVDAVVLREEPERLAVRALVDVAMEGLLCRPDGVSPGHDLVQLSDDQAHGLGRRRVSSGSGTPASSVS